MYKVLIVDDDSAIRYMLKRFKNWDLYGFQIESEACDGKEALKKLSDTGIDIVITDIKMPGMNGIELVQELRRKKMDVCVIFLSTHSDFEYAKQGIRLGVFDYMTKPVDELILGEVLERTKHYLDEMNHKRMRTEKERKIIGDSYHIYYSEQREKSLFSLLMTGRAELMPEAQNTAMDIIGALKGDLVKSGILLEMVLIKLKEGIRSAHPWLTFVEKMESDEISKANNKSEDEIKAEFVKQVMLLQSILAKYELQQNDSVVRKICEYVIKHAEEDIKLGDIAQVVHLRSDYIGKLFKKKTDQKLNDYITKVKMEHAKYLITSGDFKNYEISERLGYSSSDYFCRIFKQYTGHTPVEFRNLQRNL